MRHTRRFIIKTSFIAHLSKLPMQSGLFCSGTNNLVKLKPNAFLLNAKVSNSFIRMYVCVYMAVVETNFEVWRNPVSRNGS